MYFDGELSDRDRKVIDDHLVTCASCRTEYDKEKRMLLALKDLPVQGLSHDFSATIITKAIGRAQRQAMKKTGTYVGGALAACLALWIAVSTPISLRQQPMSPQSDQFSLALNTPKEIKVLLTATEDLEMASVTIRLSSNLEIQGYPANQEITWKTNIRKGKNYLTLPVIARMPGEAKLIAEVSHQDKSKLFKLNMLVQKTLINGKISYNRYTV
jgi:hypothetical protein